MPRRLTYALLFVLSCALWVVPGRQARAQGVGRISGIVTDSMGAAVTGATITAQNTGTGALRTVRSDSSGGYVFPSLLPATYTLSASASG